MVPKVGPWIGQSPNTQVHLTILALQMEDFDRSSAVDLGTIKGAIQVVRSDRVGFHEPNGHT